MNLIKTSLLNGIAVAVKVVSSIILNKILAVHVGPAGYAIIGHFQNTVSIATSLAGGVVANGITKVTAQHFDDEAKQHAVWRTAIQLSLIFSLATGGSLIIVGDWILSFLLNRSDMSNILILLALTLPAAVVNSILIAIINGKKEIGILVAANIIGSLINILITGLLVLKFGIYGALIAYTINPAIALISTVFLMFRCSWFKSHFLWGRLNQAALRELSGFGLMGLTTALCIPVSYMFIREGLASKLGLAAAGYWQAMWGISGMFLMLATSTLSVYYLPRLAEIRTASEFKAEIFKVYRFVMPLVIIGAIIIYLLRDIIILILYNPDFSPMRELFLWQLGGDVIKMGSWILGYILLGRAMVRMFILTEIIFSISFVLMCRLLVNEFGLIGVSMSYVANYSLHWLFMGYLVKHELKRMEFSNAHI